MPPKPEAGESSFQKTFEWPLRTAVFVIGCLSMVVALLFIAYFLSLFFQDLVHYGMGDYYLTIYQDPVTMQKGVEMMRRTARRAIGRMCSPSKYPPPTGQTVGEPKISTAKTNATAKTKSTRGDGRPPWLKFTGTPVNKRRKREFGDLPFPTKIYRVKKSKNMDNLSTLPIFDPERYSTQDGVEDIMNKSGMTSPPIRFPLKRPTSNMSRSNKWARISSRLAEQIAIAFGTGWSASMLRHDFSSNALYDSKDIGNEVQFFNMTRFIIQYAGHRLEKNATRGGVLHSYVKRSLQKSFFKPLGKKMGKNAGPVFHLPEKWLALYRAALNGSRNPIQADEPTEEIITSKDFDYTLCISLKSMMYEDIDEHLDDMLITYLELSRGMIHMVFVIIDLVIVIVSCLFLIASYFLIVGARRKSRSFMVPWVCVAGVAVYGACTYGICHHLVQKGTRYFEGSMVIVHVLIVIILVVLHALALWTVDKYYRALFLNERRWARDPAQIDYRR